MRRRDLLALCLASPLAALPVRAAAQQGARRPWRIYAITFRGMTDVEKGFESYFAARAIPVDITYRDLNRDASRMPGFLEEIRSLRPDLVYTWGTSVTLGVAGRYDKVDPKTHITDIPVVFTLVAAPVLAKIVPDLRSSGRNVTGVFHVAPTESQMRAMASYRPFKTVGVIFTRSENNSVVTVEELRALSGRMGFKLVAMPFAAGADNKPVADGAADMVRELKARGCDWLYLPPDSFLGTLAGKVIIPAALEAGLPTFASTEQLMQAGALTGLVSRYHAIGQFTAHKAEQILVGRVPPSRVPVETLSRFSFQIRMEVAEALRLPPPLPMFNYAELIAGTGG